MLNIKNLAERASIGFAFSFLFLFETLITYCGLQELRKLVRKVQSAIELEASVEETGKPDAAGANARRSLTRFLRGLANQLPVE